MHFHGKGLLAGSGPPAVAGREKRNRSAPPEDKSPAKKWPLRRAAKFREETPRKGGGLAIKDRDTALQQYEETRPCPQAQNYNHSRQNTSEMLEKSVTFVHFITGLLPLAAYVRCNMKQ